MNSRIVVIAAVIIIGAALAPGGSEISPILGRELTRQPQNQQIPRFPPETPGTHLGPESVREWSGGHAPGVPPIESIVAVQENGAIDNIKDFLELCPTDDPIYDQIRADFTIRKNDAVVGALTCTGPVSTIPIAEWTDELIAVQGLRTIYYMDLGMSGHLPWTNGATLYDWMKSKIGGINIKGQSPYCCEDFGGELYFVVPEADDSNRDFDRYWKGIAGNIGLYGHETRHVDGYGHVSCCGIDYGCDAFYLVNDLTPYGIQWWLNALWVTGDINVGFGCLPSSEMYDIAYWHLTSCDGFRDRFCYSFPPVLSMPDEPGGPCPLHSGPAAGFDDDNFADLAIGIPGERYESEQYAGAVGVVYGSEPNGLSASGYQKWMQGINGLGGGPEGDDYVGSALAVGDFDGDGAFDLAVGAVREDIDSSIDAGAVSVIYGSSGGLVSTGHQVWYQDAPGIQGLSDPEDYFGSSVAAGDFDGNGYDDLAVGVPREEIGSVTDAGAVAVIYGSAAGLTDAGNQLWSQDSPGISGAAEEIDCFGAAVAVGDFDNDGYDDLAVGVVYEDINAQTNAGSVNVIYGSSAGLTEAGNQGWHQDVPGIADECDFGDEFGGFLTVGDFDGDGYDDLAVGVLNEDIGTISDAGAVNVIYGSAGGLTADGNQLWSQDSPGISGMAEDDDAFGRELAAGDFNGDGFDDLAVGVQLEDINTATNAGSVNVIYGSASGLTEADNQGWHQDVPGMADACEDFDRFGFALAAGDFNGDAYVDLAVGVFEEDVGAVSDAGAVNVIYGSSLGLTTDGNQFWHEGYVELGLDAEEDDLFGFALAAPPSPALFAGDFECGDVSRWSGSAAN